MESRKIIWILILSSFSISLNRCKTEEIILHGEISGYVIDAETSQPLQAVTVKLNPVNHTTNTGKEGKFLFKSLAPGDYEIEASKQAYSKSKKTTTVTSTNTREINFVLDAIPVIHYSETLLDFGFYLTSLSFTISKNGPGKVAYIFTPNKDWIAVDPRSGDMDDETDSVKVNINRTGLTQIINNEWIIITSTYRQYNFQDTINVNIKVHNEIVFNPDISYGTVADIEGNVYKTIQIGGQVWMAENLKTVKYNDNTPIPLVADNSTWKDLKTPGYCWYNNDESTFKDIYGALYNWYTVKTGKLCPQSWLGWHVPNDTDWHELILYVDPNAILGIDESTIAGDKMKETGTLNWFAPNTGATNSYGFTALPAGYRTVNGSFSPINKQAAWWASTEHDPTHPFYRAILTNYSDFWRLYDAIENIGFSVRCIKNIPEK